MRIGELSAVVGVTTRAIRHYHHLGLLPEPERRPNGYRDYGLRHAVVLARIRRLTELGLGLPEVRDVLADDAGRELVAVLGELDDDLARQEEALRVRRARLRGLLADAAAGRLPAEGPVSPELGALLGELADSGYPPGGVESPMAAKDRELLVLLDSTAATGDQARMAALLGDVVRAPGGVERANEVYALLDALAGAEADDPRVADAARALADLLPASLADAGVTLDALDGPPDSFMEAFFAEFSPAQAEAVRQGVRLVLERGAG
ncbi:MerR family transcriptional regulator [Streptomyces sp. NPDC091292]|uniref:MerR family transcriptional regulator n=1 Tax=Streptomyces sp. NPDC091292 TaxID=3365991 RepID=UPI00382C84D4